MSPRAIPGPRFCEMCGSVLKSYQLRFCSLACSLEWNHHDRATRAKQGRTLSAMMERGETPKPPRAVGPFRYADPELRAAMHHIKTGGRVAELPEHQRELFRAYNRECSRRRKERQRAAVRGDVSATREAVGE